MSSDVTATTVVIGASAAGLATSACLQRASAEHVLLEQAEHVGGAWRDHYERLHLHTHKGASGLPFVPFDDEIPRYPSREQVVAYFEGYVGKLGLKPRFGEGVTSVRGEGDGWIVESSKARYRCRNVVIATGLTRKPFQPSWPGEGDYRGEVMHSSRYRNGEPWRGRRVLVIGFGNSAGEIAIDLFEHGASPTLAVRGGVNVIPREVLGIPILGVGALLRAFPPRFGDVIGSPLTRLVIGDITKLGLRKAPRGPMEELHASGRVPLIDIGTIAAIRAGQIAVRHGVDRFTARGVVFEGGEEEAFDAVVVATGYRPALADFLGEAAQLCAADGKPRSGVAVRPGLFFCGFQVSPRGMLNEIAREARRVAKAIVASA